MESKPTKSNQNENCSTSEKKLCENDFYSSDFEVLVHKDYYIDKSLFIKEFVNSKDKNILIIAPDGFGKSTNMSMLKKFLEFQVNENGMISTRAGSPNYKLFQEHNLLVYQDEDFFDLHFSSRPVMYFNLKNIKGNTYREIINQFHLLLVLEVFGQHSYLANSTHLTIEEIELFERFYKIELDDGLPETDIEMDIISGIQLLLDYVSKHFGNRKVVALFDDYDTFLEHIISKSSIERKKIHHVLDSIIYHFMASYRVKKTLFAGFFYYFSFECDIKMHMFLDNHAFVPYYGLTEFEFSSLLKKYQVEVDLRKHIKLNCGGYVSLNGIKMFSILPILHMLEKDTVEKLCVQPIKKITFFNALKIDEVKSAIETLCSNRSVTIDLLLELSILDIDNFRKIYLLNLDHPYLHYNLRLFMTFLLQEGFLAYRKIIDYDNIQVKIVNAKFMQKLQLYLKAFNEQTDYL